MGGNIKSRKRFWATVGLLCVLPLTTYIFGKTIPNSIADNTWTLLVWLVYLILAFALDSKPLVFMLIGAFSGYYNWGLEPPVSPPRPVKEPLPLIITAAVCGCIFGISCDIRDSMKKRRNEFLERREFARMREELEAELSSSPN